MNEEYNCEMCCGTGDSSDRSSPVSEKCTQCGGDGRDNFDPDAGRDDL